jgi:hypothetical protein
MILLTEVPTGWCLDPEKEASRQHNYPGCRGLLEKTADNVSSLRLSLWYKNSDEQGGKNIQLILAAIPVDWDNVSSFL